MRDREIFDRNQQTIWIKCIKFDCYLSTYRPQQPHENYWYRKSRDEHLRYGCSLPRGPLPRTRGARIVRRTECTPASKRPAPFERRNEMRIAGGGKTLYCQLIIYEAVVFRSRKFKRYRVWWMDCWRLVRAPRRWNTVWCSIVVNDNICFPHFTTTGRWWVDNSLIMASVHIFASRRNPWKCLCRRMYGKSEWESMVC